MLGRAAKFAPTELLSCPQAMAIRAAHVALVDLSGDDMPTFSRGEPGDRLDLQRRVAVVQIEDCGIGFPTIYAGMEQQKAAEALTIVDPLLGCLQRGATDVVITVEEVMHPAVGRMTPAAIGLQTAIRDVGGGERHDGLRVATGTAHAQCGRVAIQWESWLQADRENQTAGLSVGGGS